VRLEVQGTALRLYAADALVLSTTDSTITTGHYTGISADNWPQYIDDFRCGVFPYVARPASSATTSTVLTPPASEEVAPGSGRSGAPMAGTTSRPTPLAAAAVVDYVTFRPANVGTPDMWVEVQGRSGRFLRRDQLSSPPGQRQRHRLPRLLGSGRVLQDRQECRRQLRRRRLRHVGCRCLQREAALETQGTAIRLYANDVLVASATDSSIIHWQLRRDETAPRVRSSTTSGAGRSRTRHDALPRIRSGTQRGGRVCLVSWSRVAPLPTSSPRRGPAQTTLPGLLHRGRSPSRPAAPITNTIQGNRGN
jgi:hypothetical protein